MSAGAVISDCGTYRYRLTRVWASGEGALLWVMLNPSTADASVDDATIRRCKAFSRSWGYGGLMVGNLYAYRSTSPAAMWRARKAGVDIAGPDNLGHLCDMARLATGIVCAWGTHAERAGNDWRKIARTLLTIRPQLLKLRLTNDGYPQHPLRLPASLQPSPFYPTLPTE